MKRLINETMKRAILIVTLIALILVWGGMSAWQIQRDYLPEINNPTLSVTVRADNYQAELVKVKITEPIQQAVRVVEGLQDVETNSFNGGSLISLNFPMNYDMKHAEEQVSKAIEDITLPSGIEKPLVTRLSTHTMPIMRMSLMSSSGNINRKYPTHCHSGRFCESIENRSRGKGCSSVRRRNCRICRKPEDGVIKKGWFND